MLLVYLVVQRKRNLAKRLPLGGKLARSATDEGGYISAHYMKKSANISYSNRNDTWVVPPYSNVTFLPFLSGSGESENVRISLAECGSEQPEIVARNTAAHKIFTIKI